VEVGLTCCRALSEGAALRSIDRQDSSGASPPSERGTSRRDRLPCGLPASSTPPAAARLAIGMISPGAGGALLRETRGSRPRNRRGPVAALWGRGGSRPASSRWSPRARLRALAPRGLCALPSRSARAPRDPTRFPLVDAGAFQRRFNENGATGAHPHPRAGDVPATTRTRPHARLRLVQRAAGRGSAAGGLLAALPTALEGDSWAPPPGGDEGGARALCALYSPRRRSTRGCARGRVGRCPRSSRLRVLLAESRAIIARSRRLFVEPSPRLHLRDLRLLVLRTLRGRRRRRWPSSSRRAAALAGGLPHRGARAREAHRALNHDGHHAHSPQSLLLFTIVAPQLSAWAALLLLPEILNENDADGAESIRDACGGRPSAGRRRIHAPVRSGDGARADVAGALMQSGGPGVPLASRRGQDRTTSPLARLPRGEAAEERGVLGEGSPEPSRYTSTLRRACGRQVRMPRRSGSRAEVLDLPVGAAQLRLGRRFDLGPRRRVEASRKAFLSGSAIRVSAAWLAAGPAAGMRR